MAQTMRRALQVVGYLAESPRSLRDVAELLRVHKPTALRLLQAVAAEGFARCDGQAATQSDLVW